MFGKNYKFGRELGFPTPRIFNFTKTQAYSVISNFTHRTQEISNFLQSWRNFSRNVYWQKL